MKLHIRTYDLPLANTFRITHESRDIQPTVIVGLEDHEGRIGWGEATAVPYYGQSTQKLVTNLEKQRTRIEGNQLDSPEQFWADMFELFPTDPFELCALDIAANDLYGKQQGLPLYQIWDLDISKRPLTNYTIGRAPIPEMQSKLTAWPWPLYKVKLGTDHDLEIIKALREVSPSPFRIDANTAWTAEQCIEYAPLLKDLNVEFIEQPLPADAWEDQKKVFEQSILPLMADESCQTESDVDACVGYFHGINIKLVKCGGLTPARRMIKRARELDLKVMVGCMTESSVGISAIAHLLPLLDYVDMDGALLLSKDIASGVRIENGITYYVDAPGTGAKLLDYP